jgi:hypothetical protein
MISAAEILAAHDARSTADRQDLCEQVLDRVFPTSLDSRRKEVRVGAPEPCPVASQGETGCIDARILNLAALSSQRTVHEYGFE